MACLLYQKLQKNCRPWVPTQRKIEAARSKVLRKFCCSWAVRRSTNVPNIPFTAQPDVLILSYLSFALSCSLRKRAHFENSSCADVAVKSRFRRTTSLRSLLDSSASLACGTGSLVKRFQSWGEVSELAVHTPLQNCTIPDR